MSVGPIVFADLTARNQLLEEGVVTTFRASDRTTGETDARWKRTGRAKADVTVEHVAAVDPSDIDQLVPYWEHSGFSSPAEWQTAIEEINGGSLGEGHVYRVTLDGTRVDLVTDGDSLPEFGNVDGRFTATVDQEEDRQ